MKEYRNSQTTRSPELRDFIRTLRNVRNANPGLGVDALVDKALQQSPSRFHIPDINIRKVINDLVTRFSCNRKNLSGRLYHRLFEIICGIGRRHGLTSRPTAKGLMFRHDILDYVLANSRPARYSYSRKYATKVFYKYFRKIARSASDL